MNKNRLSISTYGVILHNLSVRHVEGSAGEPGETVLVQLAAELVEAKVAPSAASL
jgi:hypothetical protein